MYENNIYRWYKHLGFILIDIICMEAAFWLADAVPQGMNQTIEKIGNYTVLTKSVRMVTLQQFT